MIDVAGTAIRQVLYPLWAAKNGSARLQYLGELEASQFWPRDVLLHQQFARLQALVEHAYQTCAYYRHRFDRAGVTPRDLRSREDFNAFPILNKEDVQQHQAEMISSRFATDSLIRDATGGSTGTPMQFCYTRDRLDSRVAATLRHNRWAGWSVGDRAAVLWGAPQDTQVPARIKDRVRDWIQDRRLILDASSITDESMAEFARKLIRYRPKVLQAYANTLGLFARFVRSEGINGIHPQAIVTSAEVLTDDNRSLIEETFHCPVFNRYGSREVAVIASECEKHSGLHLNAENLFVEVLVDGRSTIGAEGEILITDLRNLAMPLIRYRIRDMGRLSEQVCSCGRGLPLLELTGGRVTDFLLASDGRRVSGIVLATYVITNIPGVRQVQFVQRQRRSVVVHVVRGESWSERCRTELVTKVQNYLGAETIPEIVFRDEIPLEPSGKYRFSISSVAAAAH